VQRDAAAEPLQTLDARGRVIYVGSFSKTLSPALRLGFLVAPASLRSAVYKAKFVTDWHTSTLAQMALAHFIEDGGFARHIRRVNRIYGERHATLVKIVGRDHRDHLELIPSTTGLHLAALAKTGSVERISAVARRAASIGIALQTLSSFSVRGAGRAGIVLGYGTIPASLIEEGLRQLKRCFED
jgi:GntR family transcriptional regulator / MocR family aminotransferase